MNQIALNFAIPFAVMFVLDYVWAYYTVACATLQPNRAAVFAVGITALNAALVLLYVTDPSSIIAACIGAFVGTWLSVHIQLRRKRFAT